MVSLKSLYLFALTNFILLAEALFTFYLFESFSIVDPFGIESIAIATITLAAKNYSLVKLIDSGQTHKLLIGGEKRTIPKEAYPFEFFTRMIMASFIEAMTYAIIFRYDLLKKHIDWRESVAFIPISFLFELVFDFFHYWMHRILHSIPQLYVALHKSHHKFHHPNAMTTFYQNPFDLLLSNSFPTLATLLIVTQFFEISTLAFFAIAAYKTFIEISGHTGKEEKTSSFVQFIWLPRWLGIELYTHDHDLHHTRNNCNYAKRFSFYDKLFGTYACKDVFIHSN